MKVLAIAADLNISSIGGAEAHFIEVLKRISPKIKSVTVFVGKSLSIKSCFLDCPNVEFITVDYPRIQNFSWLFYILYVVPKAVIQCRKSKYDLVWVKQEYLGLAGLFIKLFTGLPLYITAQNPNLASEEWVAKGTLFHLMQKLFANKLAPLFMAGFRKADVVAAVSTYSANLATKMGAKRVVVIPNGVDLDKFNCRKLTKLNDRADEFKIITTSSLIPRNGVDTLIKACAGIPDNYRWCLTIAGDGPQKIELEETVGRLGIKDRIKFLGRVTNDKIPDLLAKSDLFVRPSRFEGFGNSFIEAMAMEIPVIGTPVGGITDFIKDRETGFLVPVEDIPRLTGTIVELYEDRNLGIKIARNGRKFVEERYSWDNIAQKVLKEMFACL